MELKKISQRKLEFLIALGFSAIIFVLSSTNIGYIPLSPHRSLDMAMIPAIFAAMIGGYRVGIPVAILWGFCAYINQASNLQIFTLWGLMVNRLVLVTVAYHAYKVCKKYYQFSPANVYRAIFAAVTAKNITSDIILGYVFIVDVDYDFEVKSWAMQTMYQYVVELALCSLAMMFLIKHLRQIHILNGVKRREKARVRAKAKADLEDFNKQTEG